MHNHLPNLKHLQYLVALDTHQHFLKASQACFVSQSTLSSAILKLEQQLDCQLLEREHKNFVFTRHGRAVVKLAKELIGQANEFVNFSKQQGDPNKGKLYVGSIPTIAPFLLTDILQLCEERFPELEIFISEHPTEELLKLLDEGEIDTAILALPIEERFQTKFAVRTLGKDPFFLVGEQDLIKNYHKYHDFNAIPDEHVFLLSNEHCLTEHALSACKLVDPAKINPFQATSIATLMQMTTFHNGVTFLPEMAINKGIAESIKLKITALKNQPYRTIALLSRKNSQQTPKFDILEQLISGFLNP